MDPDIYGLSGNDVERLRRLLESFEGGARLKQADGARAKGGADVVQTYLALTTSEISAAAEVTTAITQLNGAMDDTQVTMIVDSIDDFPSNRPFVLRIGSEDILVLAWTGISVISIERGYNGTTPAAHADNAAVNLIVFTLGSGTAYVSKAIFNPDEDYDLNEDEHFARPFYNPSTDAEKIYNASTSTIASGTRLHVLRDPFEGIFVVVKPPPSSVADWSTSTPGILSTGSLQTGKGEKRTELGTPAGAGGWTISHTQSDTSWVAGIKPWQLELPFSSYGAASSVDPIGGVAGYVGFMRPIDEVLNAVQPVLAFRQESPIVFARITTSVSPAIVDGNIATAFTIPAALDDTVTVEIGDTTGLSPGDYVIILGTTTEHGDDCYLSGLVDSVVDADEFVLQLKGIQKGATFGDEVDAGTVYRVAYAEGCRALAYTPGDSGDWDGDPADIQEALDRLAAAVAAEIGVPIP